MRLKHPTLREIGDPDVIVLLEDVRGIFVGSLHWGFSAFPVMRSLLSPGA